MQNKNQTNTKAAKIWQLIENTLPELIGIAIDPYLGLGLKLCFLIWHLIKEENQ